MKKEIRIFFTAVMFFTRLPCPAWVDHSEEYLNKSSRYFTLVGVIVGIISALGFLLFNLVFPQFLSVILCMALSALVTGAFHEDGLADFMDGFGGGWTKEKILDIMKDSRLGTFGVLGLVFVLSVKAGALIEFHPYDVPLLLVSGHALSRLTAVSLIYTHTYAREDQDSKAKPLATKMTRQDLGIALVCGLLPLVLVWNPWILLALAPQVLLRGYLARMFVKWIGGYTGDCLGATQQLAEVVFYFSAYLIFKYLPWN